MRYLHHIAADNGARKIGTVMSADLGPLDRLATVFAVVDAASQYGYSAGASMQAVVEGLKDCDADDLRLIAAVLAALMVSDLRPRGPDSFAEWCEHYGFLVASKDRAE